MEVNWTRVEFVIVTHSNELQAIPPAGNNSTLPRSDESTYTDVPGGTRTLLLAVNIERKPERPSLAAWYSPSVTLDIGSEGYWR